MKKYKKPICEKVYLEHTTLLAASINQCDCYSHRTHQGCNGCKGNCGCNHWDPDLEEIIPGC